ncbi:MAG TPA: asparaginase [Candidatus Acidoferrales bacterium]|jgi:L-asparaginase II|nr:asparaginase [Candidatus Acidoferrales bacterium]
MMPRPLEGEPFVAVERGGLVESIHNVAACAVDRAGKTIFSLGEIDVPVLLRSTAKPFIAAAAVREGVVERFGLEPREIAIMAASHNGETFHADAVRSILRKIGEPEAALLCGPHPPYDERAAAALRESGEAFSSVHNNCSGKHAGILALTALLGASDANYLDPHHAAQRLILALCARLSDARVEDLPLAIDGCGIPVYAVSLRSAALSYARLATLEGIDERDARALRVVRDAMIAYPAYVAGTGDFDTVLMESARGNLLAKSGAEGLHGTAALRQGTGVVLKVADGNGRAVAPAMLAILDELGLLDGTDAQALERFAHPPIYNRAGRLVGGISPLSRHATKRST